MKIKTVHTRHAAFIRSDRHIIQLFFGTFAMALRGKNRAEAALHLILGHCFVQRVVLQLLTDAVLLHAVIPALSLTEGRDGGVAVSPSLGVTSCLHLVYRTVNHNKALFRTEELLSIAGYIHAIFDC